MSKPVHLLIRNFAQIEEASLEFGDLTVLVGAQATGKSLALQWLKFAIDGKQVVSALRDAGHHTRDRGTLLDLLFGSGMSAAWDEHTKIELDGEEILPLNLVHRGRRDGKGKVFFIPAHRAMLMSDGWAAPFQRLTADVPVVARLFSQNLFERFRAKWVSDLFPVTGRLKKSYREAIDRAIFHGGQVAVEDDPTRHARRIVLRHGETRIPYMTWTAGQREFTPLLLGLYALLPSVSRRRTEPVEWVVIEEPEMGLHPKAVNVVMMLVLDLLWRGYRVVLSTHSPDVLAAVWMLQQLKAHRARWKLVTKGFGLRSQGAMQEVAETALKATYRAHYMYFVDGGKVRSKDISALDAWAEDPAIAEWGGLTEFTTNYSKAVAAAVNAAAGKKKRRGK